MPDPAAAKRTLSTLVLGLACGMATTLFWAVGLIAAKHGVDSGLGPADVAFHRNIWVGLVLLPVLALRGELGDLGGIGWARGAALTVFGGAPFAILSATGFLLVPLGHGSVIQPSCAALGGIVLSALVLREAMPATRFLGAAAMVAGLLLLGWEAVATIGAHGLLGDLTFASAGLSFAIFGTMLRLWRISPMRAVVVVSVLSVGYVPVHWAVFGFGPMIAAGWAENLLQIAVQGVFAGTLSIYLFTRTVILLGPSRASVFAALVPPVTVLLGIPLLGEVPSLIQLAGLVAVGIGFRFAMKG